MVVSLFGTALLTCGLGFAIRPFFYLSLAAVVTAVAYGILLAYFSHVAIEQAQKVVVLETRREMAIALDEARGHSGGAFPAARPKVGGMCWRVPDEEIVNGRPELIAVGR